MAQLGVGLPRPARRNGPLHIGKESIPYIDEPIQHIKEPLPICLAVPASPLRLDSEWDFARGLAVLTAYGLLHARATDSRLRPRQSSRTEELALCRRLYVHVLVLLREVTERAH